MTIRLVITEGSRKGEEFVIKGEITIGRSKGDLQLKDTKVSNPHARFVISGDIIELEDLGSTNGTFVNGKKIQRSLVKPGDRLIIGRTHIKVETATASSESEAEHIEKGSWQEIVDRSLTQALLKAEKSFARSSGSKAFNPLVRLEVAQGIQAGSQFTFSFGPRILGSDSMDALVLDNECPSVTMEFLPNEDGSCQFKTSSKLVTVNGVASGNEKLKDGDRIGFGHTIIVVKHLINL